ncbi:MAG: hypothetical protein R3301_16045 [Saprospiraceae bacterium]|nr:hypothetical protein [Saprospiraceae bacterium]
MAVSLPLEPVYYYECYNGEFRLTYFIPFDHLKKRVDQGQADAAVLKDYPLGVDLDCSGSDYRDFTRKYRYPLPFEADACRKAFLAIYSSTRGWKRFRGTGLIPAKDLEKYIKPISEELESRDLTSRQFLPPTADLPLSARVKQARKKMAVQKKTRQFLHQFQVAEMDKSKPLNQQPFSKIRKEKGKETTEEFYRRLYQKK